MFNLKFNKTMKDLQWSVISLFSAALVNLILRIMLSKELGPSGLGMYTLVFAIYMFGMQFAGFGIGSALTQYIAEHHGDISKIKEFNSSGIFGSLVSGLVMGLLLYLFANLISIQFFHNPSMTPLLKLVVFCFPFIAVQKAVIGTLNGLREMRLYAIVNITQNVSVFVITVILVHSLDMNIMGAVLGFVIPTILIGVLSLIFVRDLLVLPPKLANKALKEISLFGFYVVLANSIGMISVQVDSLLIGHFMNETEVGYYAVAIVFVQGITLLPDAIQRVTNPLIATYYGKKDYDSIRHLIRETMIKTLLITIFIDFFIAAFGKIMIAKIFTVEFIPAYAPLLILLIGYSIYAPFVAVGSCLSSIGKIQVIFKISIISAVLNTVLNVIAIPKFGIIGAACATSISLVITTLINIYFVERYTSRRYLGIFGSNLKDAAGN